MQEDLTKLLRLSKYSFHELIEKSYGTVTVSVYDNLKNLYIARIIPKPIIQENHKMKVHLNKMLAFKNTRHPNICNIIDFMELQEAYIFISNY